MDSQSNLQNETDRNKQLMRLMIQNQRRIFSYIYTLAPDRQAAEELLQDTSLVICEKFHEFTPGTNFLAWACQIALWRVRSARLKFARSKIIFDDRLLETVAHTTGQLADELDARHVALENCLKKLPTRDRELLFTRYAFDGSVKGAAQRTGRSLAAAYKALARTRKLLLNCVTSYLTSQRAI